MLHRSFKPAKCKTSLKLAASRLKLMKNKKEVQLKQVKRELAQLLESKQDQTARIRVENAVREENTIAAYELLEIYCEIIAARLPIIESQKNCPNDLKEAIASVIFASPRCADITEFADIRKHFTSKYGKEFVTAAVELRPESGVSRMLVEKLSVKAPDGETKIKILSAIAEEHNIKWDPTAFGVQEANPRDDFLNGPNTFENASKTHMELPAVPTGPPSFQAPPSSDLKDNNAPPSFKQNATSASNLQNVTSGDGSSGSTATQAAAYPGRMPSGSGSERMDATHSHSRDGNAYSAGNHNWNMEFKDATAAAEAAAEAAERASMAARAAAELSGRGHITTESPRFKSQGSRVDRPSESVGSKLSGKQFSKDSMQDTVYDTDPNIKSGQVDRNEQAKQEGFSERFHQDSRNSIKESRLASLRPTIGSNDDEKPMNKRQQEVKVTKVKKDRVFSEVNARNQKSKTDVNFQSDDKQYDMHHDDLDHFGEERPKEKASEVTSQSHSINHGTACGISHSRHQSSSNEDSENLFPTYNQDTTHGDAPVDFDDPLSDDHDDDFGLNTRSGYDAIEDPSPSSNRKTIHRDAVAKTSPSSNAVAAFDESDSDDDVAFGFTSHPGYDESLTEPKDYLEELDVLPVNFDDLGGPSSESEDELVNSRLTSKEKQALHMSPGDKEQVNAIADSNQRVEFGVQSSLKFDSDDILSGQLPSRHSKTSLASNSMASDNNTPESPSTINDDRYLNPSSTESNSELKFGNLRGGLRNKRSPYTIYPPVAAATASTTPPEDTAATTKQASPSSATGTGSSTNTEAIAEVKQNPSSKTTTRLSDVDSADTNEEETPISSGRAGGVFSRRTKGNSGLVVQSSLNARSKTDFKHKLSSPTSVADSDSDDSEEELSKKHLNRRRQPSTVKLQSGSPVKKYFDSNDSASDALEHASPISARTGAVPSRRTKASPSSGTKSYTKTRVSGEETNPDANLEQNPSSYVAPSKPEPQKVKPTRQSSTAEQSATPKPIPKNDMKSESSSAIGKTSSPLILFDSNDGVSDALEHASPISGRTEEVPSRRKKASPSSGTKSYTKARVSGDAINSDANLEQKPSSSSFSSVAASKPEPQKVKPARECSSVEQNTEHATPKPIPKNDLKSESSSAMEQASAPLKTAAVSGGGVSPKPSSSSSGNDPSKEGTLKKASHVHPKLPDYDSLAATLQSLRENRG